MVSYTLIGIKNLKKFLEVYLMRDGKGKREIYKYM